MLRGADLRLAPPVDVHEVDASPATTGERADHGAEGGRRTATATDHLAEVRRVHAHLEDRPAAQLLVAHGDVVGVLHDPADQVLECLGEHRDQASPCSADFSSAAAGASVSAGFSASGAVAVFLAAAFLVTASPLGSLAESLRASLKISCLSRLGSLVRSVPSVPGSPLNFCQSPVTLR